MAAVAAATLTAALPGVAVQAGAAGAQVPVAEAAYSGFATGTVVHTGALQSGATRLVGVEAAQSNAAVDSDGLDEVVSELDRRIAPADPGHQSYGRGVGLELGIAVDQPAENQVQLAGVAEAAAPPSTDLVTEEIAVPAAPLAYSSTVRGQAQARFRAAECVLGSDLSYGLGFAEDLQLLDTGSSEGGPLDAPILATDADGPARAVSQSVSRTRLVPQTAPDGTVTGTNVGLSAETRQTIAPVTLLEGTPGEMTIEFLGEWVLRATATGLPGGARVHYGPGEVTPHTPILRILDAAGEVTDILSFQDILGPEGVSIGEIVVIGEDPRAIGGDSTSAPAVAADGTSVAAAVDVLRVQLPPSGGDPGDPSALDLRVGHMEVSATVPAGGISCPLPVSKTSDPETVTPGDEFTYTIAVPAVPNPHDCTLTNVRVVDTIEVLEGDVRYTVLGADPPASSQDGGTLTFDDVGPIPPGAQRIITIRVRIDDDSGTGRLRNTVGVTATCPIGSADSDTAVGVGLSGGTQVNVPAVNDVLDATVSPGGGAPLPKTGGEPALAAVAALLLAVAVGARQLLRRAGA
jgi:uncharacterized repeat protein (TIGR01451 family)